MENFGKLIVITGTTVSGKDTVVAELLKNHPDWQKIVTTTTRSPRPEEQIDIDYHFIDLATFLEMQDNDDFLESVEYADNHYGTTKATFRAVLQGQTIIWRIDASRASQIDKLFDDCFDKETATFLKNRTRVIYLKLPDSATRQKHFLKRGMEATDIKKRIKQDKIDFNLGNFKNIVINYEGKLEKTVDKVEAIIAT